MGQHLLELGVFKEGTLRVGKSLQKRLLQVLKDLGVVSSVFFELGQLFFQRLLLFSNKSSKELLFKTSLCDSEINDSGLGEDFGRVMRVGKSRGHVDVELLIIVKFLISNHNELVSASLGNLLLKQGIKHGINFVFNRFNEKR